jgi:hypothetical protein
MTSPTQNLKAGDHLLYDVDHLLDDPIGYLQDLVIRVKTWSSVAHIEVYDGGGCSLAARADGIHRYPFRASGLKLVRRPRHWDHFRAREYFSVVEGQNYDWAGLLCFTLAVKQGSPNKQFCSEFARNLGRAAGSVAFDAHWPGDKVAPGNFEMVGDFETLK